MTMTTFKWLMINKILKINLIVLHIKKIKNRVLNISKKIKLIFQIKENIYLDTA